MGQIMLNGNAYGGINGPSVGDRIVVIPTFESGAKLADIVINNETTSIYMPSGGIINDIQVNNVSVVDQYGVGKIDLSPYQLILTPGQYLSINNNTISTTFGIFQGATTSSSGTYGLVPTPSTTDKELFLKGDGTWSELPASGRTIIANPETVPTDNLTKILIDNTTYAVAATDEKVTQTETTTDADYELLFSETADDTTRTEGSRKSENLLYNPNDITLTVGTTTGMTIDGDNGDINLIGSGDTWDGTYTSLKDAIANAGGGGGTSDLDAVELTKAQYDALTPEQKADEDKIYFVKDYIPPQPGGGSTVSITPSLSSGTKVADYEIDGVAGELYAPTPSAGSVVEIHPLLASGREIASFTIDGVTNYLYGFDWWYTNAIACTMSSEVTINAGGIALCTFYAPVNNVENAYIFQGINLRGRKTDERYSASMVLMATVSEVYLDYDNDRIRLRIYVYNHHNYDVIISGAYAQFVEII